MISSPGWTVWRWSRSLQGFSLAVARKCGRWLLRSRADSITPPTTWWTILPCGFASTEEGNVLTYDEQRAKLALVVEVAHEVWGA
jgi:hypothetical protein